MDNRRPLKSRNTRWADRLTQMAIEKGFTPNGISQASMGFAVAAGAAFWAYGAAPGWLAVILLILGALGCQLRLLCNLLDGMVAVEGGKATADGPFWNEFPDRVSDALIMVGLGYGLGVPALGWAAAAFAFLTSYVRELGTSSGLKPDFSGPMAKPHRMALITFAACAAIFEAYWFGKGTILTIALWLVVVGSAVTVLRRSWNILNELQSTS